jgi:ribonucleoside-diphosphate reductase alpha chain
LPAGGSCLLGSLNLAAFFKEGNFNYKELVKSVHIAVKAMNEVLDEGLPLHPLQEQRNSVRD